MSFNENRLKTLFDLIKQIKVSVYGLVNEYRRLIHAASLGNKDFTKMCRITDGQVDENGNIYVTKDILANFSEKFKRKCILEAAYWCKYLPALDTFIKHMMNFDDPIVLLKTKNEQLRHLYECWLGDVYKDKYELGFISFLKDIDETKKNINIDMFKELNNKEDEEETLLHGLPL